MSSAATPAVETRGLYRRYGRLWALAGLDLIVDPGARVMLAGPNGSGKSTLLRVLAGALRPTLGTVRVAGVELAKDRGEVRRRVAHLGHQLYHYRSLSALENLQIVARLLGLPAQRQDLEPALERVRLAHRADAQVATFSAGMRKRLALARVLLQVEAPARDGAASGVSLLLLDEPYGELDADGFRFVDGLLEELVQQGVTVLMATHLLDRGARFCDHAVLLERGQKVWQGPARELPGLEAGRGAREAAGGLP